MRTKALLVACTLAAAVAPAGARATHADGTYEQPPFGTPWDTASMDVLVLPPPHGQVLNDNGVLNGFDGAELSPTGNSYLAAIEDSIQAWRRAVAAFAPTWLRTRLKLRTYVVGRDEVPDAALRDPEIVITTSPHQGEAIGLTLQGPFLLPGVRCVISNARFFTASFTYADMFNTNVHEVGHCLGIDHVAGDHPASDIMTSVYPDLPGEAGNRVRCPSNLNVRGIQGAFGALFGKPGPRTVSMATSAYRQVRCPSG